MNVSVSRPAPRRASRGHASRRTRADRTMQRVRCPASACSVALLLCAGVLVCSNASAQARPFLPGTIADPAAWRGAAPAGPVTPGPNGPELTIRQTVPRATLDWLRFDVRAGETVRFDQQGNRDWAALNRVLDPTGRPSEIAGRIVADGQIFLINQNGIVFRPTAQVDVHSLVASTLNINPDAFVRGLLSVRQGTAQFEVGDGNRDASIRVEGVRGPDGRTLVQAATLSAQDGGRIFLLAAREVVNEGRLQVRDGQIVLAAGERVYLFAPAEGSGTGLRGLFVEVDGGRTATNLGEIVAARGNATLVGLAVNQSGRITANSAEVGNGSVWLLARSGVRFEADGRRVATVGGAVTLSPDSVTESRPESTGTGVVDAVALNPSQVRIEGARVHLQGDGVRGAQVIVPGGQVSVLATAVPGTLPQPDARQPVAPSDSRLLVDGGVRVDVSGVNDVTVPASRNVVAVELRGDVVADAPLLRDGPLFGQTVNVDVRTGSPLFGNADTVQRVAASQIRRSIDERSTAGGTVSLASDGDVIVNPGATFGIAGGTVRYTPAELRVSRLGDGAGTVSVSQATPDRTYTFVVDRYQTFDPRWNVRRSYESAYRYPVDPGSIEGRPAGSLLIEAPWVRWAGGVEAQTTVGRTQFTSPPAGGLFALGDRTQFGQRFADFRVLSPIVLTDGLADALGAVAFARPRTEVFGDADAPLPQRVDATALVAGGVARIQAASNASVTLAPGAPLVLPTGGQVALGGRRVSVERDLRVPSARAESVPLASGASVPLAGVELYAPITAGDIDPVTGGPRPEARGTVSIAAGTRVDTSGRWVVEPAGARPETSSEGWLRDGGSIRAAGATDVVLGEGAVLDASGGALRDGARRLTGGDGGRIALQVAGRGDPGDPPPPAAGTLSIAGAQLQSYGFRQNGALRLDAPNVSIDAVASQEDGWLPLTPALFGSGAFGRYEVNATDTLRVGAVALAPRQSNFEADQRAVPVLTAEALREIAAPRRLDDAVRRPVSVAFASTSPYRATTTVAAGATIDADPRASVRIASDYRLGFDGAIRAPGGTIELSTGRAPRSAPLPLREDEVLRVGPSARLDASGADLLVIEPNGRRTGEVLRGGTVDVAAQRGVLAIEPGATIDVSGASGVRDAVPTSGAAGARPAPTPIGSPAGRVALTAGAGGWAAPTVVGRPGSPEAAGATVEVRHAVSDSDAAPARVLTVTGPEAVRPDALAGASALRDAAGVRTVDPVAGTASVDLRVSRDTLSPRGGAADSVTLAARDRVALESVERIDAARAVRIESAELAVTAARGTVSIAAPSVEIGQPVSQSAPVAVEPQAGAATLRIDASEHVDFVGRVAIGGVRELDVRTGGDVRLVGQYPLSDVPRARSQGELATSGSIVLDANRVYPTTLSDYTVRTAPDARIDLRANGAESGPPLSALGALTLRSGTVAGSGRLHAPLGSLSIEALTAVELGAGALLSVSADGALVPVGQALSGFDWVYQVDRNNRAPIAGLPPKAVSLAAPSVSVAPGARIDLSGGGDVLGREFVRGQAGAVDLLQAPNVFAVLPGRDARLPRDASIELEDAVARAAGAAPFRGALPAGAAVAASPAPRAGDTITVGASPLLPEGTYTLLPARYAHLPGARVVVASPSAAPRSATALADGGWWVAAHRGNASGERDATWSSVAVLDAPAIARWSRYDLSTGTSYFAGRAGGETATAADAGRLTLSGSSRLAFDGRIALDGGTTLAPDASGAIVAGTARGARGELEIAAERLRIGEGAAGAGEVAVSPGFLDGLQPRTLSLGVVRAADGTRAIRSTEVAIEPGTTLAAQEVLVGATSRVAVGAGARLVAGQAAPRSADAPPTAATTVGGGAVLAVSSEPDARVARVAGASPTGSVELAAGARLEGASVALDGERLRMSPAAEVVAPRVAIGADRLQFGGTSADPGVSVLDAAQTAALSGRERFEARAGTSLGFGGPVAIGGPGTGTVRLQSPELARVPAAPAVEATVRAARVELAGGEREQAAPPAGAAAGRLAVEATGGAGEGPAGVAVNGHVAIAGFESVAIDARRSERGAGRIGLDGAGSLRTDRDLTLRGDAVVGAPAADFAIRAGGTLATRPNDGAPGAPVEAGPGARIDASAARIDHAGALRAPSGTLNLRAEGGAATDGVVLRPGSVLDASGATARVFEQTLQASGGRVDVSAARGGVRAEPGASIDVGAPARAGDVEGGAVRLAAPQGTVDVAAGTLRGGPAGTPPSAAGAALQVDAATVSTPGALLDAASAAGFNRSIVMRQRTGALEIGGPGAPVDIRAGEVDIAADAGRLGVTGRIGGTGDAPSQVALRSGDRVSLGAGTLVTADGGADGSATGRGGRVLLSGANGVSLARDARVASAASPAGDGGRVELRFDASAADPLPAGTPPGAISAPGGRIELTGVQRIAAGTTIGTASLAATRAASAAFAARRDALVARLGLAPGQDAIARPELLFTGSGDAPLTVSDALNLADYRVGGQAGVLTVRAIGDLVLAGRTIPTSRGLSAVVSDGFVDGGARAAALADPESWSMRFVAGADARAADPLAVRDAAAGGDLVLGADRSLRTGTGSIALAAARDVRIGDPAAAGSGTRESAVYTAGRPAAPVAGFDAPIAQQRPAYGTGGGDVTVSAGRDVIGAESGQLPANWLFRRAEIDAAGLVPVRQADGSYTYAGPTWGPRVDAFRQTFGALGGGSVSVAAGRDVVDVSVAVPTNARTAGPTDRPDAAVGRLTSTVLGGGGARVEAGRDVSSGSVMLQRGAGVVRAGRDVTAGRDTFGTVVGTVAALGDASLTIEAAGSARLDRAVDPTMLPQPSGAARTYFSTQGDATRLVLRSTGGDAALRSDDGGGVSLLSASGLSTLTGDAALGAAFGPHTLSIEALARDVIVQNVDVRLAPHPRGDLRLIAAGSVRGEAAGGIAPAIAMLDYDPAVLFSPRAPVPEAALDAAVPFVRVTGAARAGAASPLHAGDATPARILAGSGDVRFDGSTETAWRIELAKPADVRAGRDVSNLALDAKHPSADDRSRVQAGRDIVNPVPRTAANEIATGGSRVRVGGAGLVELIAGRDIRLGSGSGVESRGNLDDPALPGRGASIVLVAGLPDGPDYRAFLDAYVAPGAPRGRGYAAELEALLRASGVPVDGLDPAARWAAFAALPEARREAFARQVFFLEVRDAGRAAADPSSPTSGDYQKAYDAIATLFPKDGAGNIELAFTRVRSERGGDVQLLSPGAVCRGAAGDCAPGDGGTFVGNIVAGLLTPQPIRSPFQLAPTDFGVLTLGGGNVQAITGNDFSVNQSRVFTVAGGDILLWSSLGDIDAGRGSRTAIASPPPVVTVDAQGNIRVEVPGAASGSGIGTLVTRTDVPPGSVDLYAPKGAIDAGEAGIRISGSAFLGANEVRNAGAISAAGPSVGVPSASASANVSLASAGTSAASATRVASDVAEREVGESTSRQRTASRVLILEFLGFGDEGEEAWRRRQQRGR
jgi:filamentous hemagglutinin family protein